MSNWKCDGGGGSVTRKFDAPSGLRDNCTGNELNQSTGRENNTLALGGVADPDALVAARSSALAGRAGQHWGDNITVENWLAPFRGNLKVYAVKPGTGRAVSAHTRTMAAYSCRPGGWLVNSSHMTPCS